MSANPETTPAEEPPSEEGAATNLGYEYGYGHLDDLDLAPLRIRATHIHNRLSASQLQIPPGLQQHVQQEKRYSLDSKVQTVSPGSSIAGSSGFRGRSRSRSPSMRSGKATTTTHDGNSSLSSLEEFVDSDILYDKLGFVELDIKAEKNKQQHAHQWQDNSRANNLTPVSERMSEDTLEDVHAFSDLSANTNTRPSSVGTGESTVGGEVSSHVLEPLDEGDEDLESDSDVEAEGEAQVILTNLENITLQDHGSSSQKTPASKTGADSPSLPTA